MKNAIETISVLLEAGADATACCEEQGDFLKNETGFCFTAIAFSYVHASRVVGQRGACGRLSWRTEIDQTVGKYSELSGYCPVKWTRFLSGYFITRCRGVDFHAKDADGWGCALYACTAVWLSGDHAQTEHVKVLEYRWF